MEGLRQDLRHAVRSLTKAKGFTAATVLTLALGIGANTAIFSVVSGVLLRPLPLAHPERLVQLYATSSFSPQGEAVGRADLEAFRSESTSFDALAGYEVSARYLRGPAGAERVMTVAAEPDFFSMLGVAPIAGRTFQPGDPATVAVVSEAFWKRRFDGDRSVIGRSVTFDGEPFTIVGVMPQFFQFPYSAGSLLAGVATEGRTDFWIPFAPPVQAGRLRGRINVTGRLKANVSLGTAERELATIAKRLEMQYPDANRGRGVRLVPLSDAVVAKTIRRPLFILFGAVGLVLALACANVTNLSLVTFAH